jgi:hypothetical protein
MQMILEMGFQREILGSFQRRRIGVRFPEQRRWHRSPTHAGQQVLAKFTACQDLVKLSFVVLGAQRGFRPLVHHNHADREANFSDFQSVSHFLELATARGVYLS